MPGIIRASHSGGLSVLAYASGQNQLLHSNHAGKAIVENEESTGTRLIAGALLFAAV